MLHEKLLIQFCNRLAPAQALATKALSSTFEQVWLEDYSVVISYFVQFDISQ
jgi:hypothetical protein